MKKYSIFNIYKIVVMMALINIINLVSCSLFAQNSIASGQEISNPKDHIEISPELFKEIETWQSKGKKQNTPLDAFLKNSRAVDSKMKSKVTEITKQLQGQNRGSDCNCVTVTVNSSFDASSDQNSYSLDDGSSSDGLLTWYNDKIMGAANSQRLWIKSIKRRNDVSHKKSISGSSNSSKSHARMSFNYLCTNGSMLPEDCACDKILYVDAKYIAEGEVTTSIRGNHSSLASIEDNAAIFSIDQYRTEAKVTVLKGGQFRLSRAQEDSWNPDFWTSITELASSIVGIVEDFGTGIDWSDTVSDIGGQIQNVFSTPTKLHYAEGHDGGRGASFAVKYDGGLTLKPNHIVTVAMISKGHAYGKGSGKFETTSSHMSDYYMSAVLPFDDSNTECCVEKFAKWISGSTGVIGYPNLLNGVEAHVTAWGQGPTWDNLSDTNGDGNVDIGNWSGYAYQENKCIVCDDSPITGLTAVSGGRLNPAVTLSWDGKMLVSNYVIKIYDDSGNLVEVLDTTNTSISRAIAAGDYSFTVAAICSDNSGQSTISDAKYFTVTPIILIELPPIFTPIPILECGNPISGLTTISTGINSLNNTRSIKLSWSQQESVAQYFTKIYDDNGNLLHELNTIDPTITQNLTPGSYSFTVTTICENWESVTSDIKDFRVAPLVLRPIGFPIGRGAIDGSVKEDITALDTLDFVLYPNPGINDITVSVESFEKYGKLDVVITDKSGRVVFNSSLKSAAHKINIQDLKPGLYFCTLIKNDKRITKKLIKK